MVDMDWKQRHVWGRPDLPNLIERSDSLQSSLFLHKLLKLLLVCIGESFDYFSEIVEGLSSPHSFASANILPHIVEDHSAPTYLWLLGQQQSAWRVMVSS